MRIRIRLPQTDLQRWLNLHIRYPAPLIAECDITLQWWQNYDRNRRIKKIDKKLPSLLFARFELEVLSWWRIRRDGTSAAPLIIQFLTSLRPSPYSRCKDQKLFFRYNHGIKTSRFICLLITSCGTNISLNGILQ
jgi:hypothetical protein